MLISISFFSDAGIKLSVKGLSSELSKNVDARISLIDADSIDNTAYFKRYLESEIKKGLRALGYYSPKFSYQLQLNDKNKINNNNNKKETLVVTVSPGNPVLIEELNIDIQGEGKQDPEFIALIDNNTPKIGDVLDHGSYEAFKKSLQRLALRKGYFNSVMTKHELAVANKTNQAYWNIDFNTGQRYTFDKINLQPSQIQEDYLTSLIPFKKGDKYDSDLISQLNRRLSSTNWFNSVVISPHFSKVTQDKSLPIDIITTPRKKNSIDLGGGYSSDNGISGKINWNKPWINRYGHSFQSSLLMSEPETILSMNYKIPLKKSPLNDYYTIQAGAKYIDNNDTQSNLSTLGVIRNWDFSNGWKTALGINLMYDDFVQADDNYTTMLYYPSISFYKAYTDGNTLKGFSQSYSLETAAKSLASDIDFLRLQIQHSWIQGIGQSNRFIVRNTVSFIRSSDFDRVPPTLRFFAGGDRSIRGYNYKSISPTDKNGKLKGASKLITGTLEYQYNLTGEWWGALFADTGEAVDEWDKTDFYSGAGLGIRWTSPVGPIKVDLAVPINDPSRIRLNSFHLYIGLGTEL